MKILNNDVKILSSEIIVSGQTFASTIQITFSQLLCSVISKSEKTILKVPQTRDERSGKCILSGKYLWDKHQHTLTQTEYQSINIH